MENLPKDTKKKEQGLIANEPPLEEQNIPKIETSIPSNSRKHFKYRSEACLNCEQPLDLSDRYCPYCSQLNSTKQLTVSDFFSEFVNSLVSFDSRLRHTLKDLLFKPGTITRNYVNGKRLKYANPFRFFLSVSIIYFLLSSLFNVYNSDEKTFSNDDDLSMNLTRDGFKFTLNDKDDITTGIESQIDSSVAKAEKQVEEAAIYTSQQSLDSLSFVDKTVEQLKNYRIFYNETKIKDPATALEQMGHNTSRYNKWLYEKNEVIEKVIKNPNDFTYYLAKKIPFFLFFFTPIYALFFLLLYFRSGVSYMEHMIFIFHIFSFVFLTQLICFFPDQLLGGNDIFSSIVLALIGPFYFYKALRNFYKQSRLLTVFKFGILNLIFWFGASITALVFFLLTAAFY